MAFNGLTAAEAERLAILAEECAETIQAVGKILRHGYHSFNPDLLTQEMQDADETPPSNKSDLEKELGDVVFAINMLKDAGDVSRGKIETRAEVKAEKIREYLHHQGQR
jgi:NTP pyrophosphatase (non-canonical NTP hydrolase)